MEERERKMRNELKMCIKKMGYVLRKWGLPPYFRLRGNNWGCCRWVVRESEKNVRCCGHVKKVRVGWNIIIK